MRGAGRLQVVENPGSMLTAAQGCAHSQKSMVVNDWLRGFLVRTFWNPDHR
jgi:hypothetical protein